VIRAAELRPRIIEAIESAGVPGSGEPRLP